MRNAFRTFSGASKLPATVAAVCAFAFATPANAYAYIPYAAYSAAFGCASEATLTPQAPAFAIEHDKSAAILGGQVSALDLISAQQSGTIDTAPLLPAKEEQRIANVALGSCPLFGLREGLEFTLPQPVPTASEDFLGSSRVPIGKTPFDRSWRRVSKTSSAVSSVSQLDRSAGDSDLAYVSRVNAWVNRNIAFTEDTALYGQRDYWATAGETLKRMKGDCEDFAILKYHFLINAGIDPGALYLTLAWDAVRRRDHAVLVVRLGSTHYLLDNQGDQILSANESHDYAAKMSFSANRSWLHGYTSRPTMPDTQSAIRLAYFSDKAVSKARATGFSR